jgi:hypothetical protein
MNNDTYIVCALNTTCSHPPYFRFVQLLFAIFQSTCYSSAQQTNQLRHARTMQLEMPNTDNPPYSVINEAHGNMESSRLGICVTSNRENHVG